MVNGNLKEYQIKVNASEKFRIIILFQVILVFICRAYFFNSGFGMVGIAV